MASAWQACFHTITRAGSQQEQQAHTRACCACCPHWPVQDHSQTPDSVLSLQHIPADTGCTVHAVRSAAVVTSSFSSTTIGNWLQKMVLVSIRSGPITNTSCVAASTAGASAALPNSVQRKCLHQRHAPGPRHAHGRLASSLPRMQRPGPELSGDSLILMHHGQNLTRTFAEHTLLQHSCTHSYARGVHK